MPAFGEADGIDPRIFGGIGAVAVDGHGFVAEQCIAAAGDGDVAIEDFLNGGKFFGGLGRCECRGHTNHGRQCQDNCGAGKFCDADSRP